MTDHSSAGMSMVSSTITSINEAIATGTATSAAASPTATDVTVAAQCKVSMLWNWDTIDACFVSSSWHITSRAQFVGSCIAVILLVMVLEMLRRMVKGYDRYLIAKHQQKLSMMKVLPPPPSSKGKTPVGVNASGNTTGLKFRPTFFQQIVRAFLHMLTFGLAYFIMLLAMYFNGYFIISILIGAFLGYFIFGWSTLMAGDPQKETPAYYG